VIAFFGFLLLRIGTAPIGQVMLGATGSGLLLNQARQVLAEKHHDVPVVGWVFAFGSQASGHKEKEENCAWQTKRRTVTAALSDQWS